MPFLKWLEMIENGKQQTSTFCQSFILMSRGSHSNLVKKISLTSKCQTMKVTLLHFSNILLHKRRKKRCFNFQVLAFQGQWRFFDQTWLRSPWHQYKWTTKSWSLLLPIFYHFKSFQKWHLCTVSLLRYEYICRSLLYVQY